MNKTATVTLPPPPRDKQLKFCKSLSDNSACWPSQHLVTTQHASPASTVSSFVLVTHLTSWEYNCILHFI